MHPSLKQWLSKPQTTFAVGAPGAIAEFPLLRQQPDEVTESDSQVTRIAAGGALRIQWHQASRIEQAPRQHDGHGEASHAQHYQVTLPLALADLARRKGLHRIGVDRDAIQAPHRAHVLFELGLGIPWLSTMVRTDDAELIAKLETHQGDNVLSPGNAAMAAIKAASPTRVFTTCVARIEVYQRIPSRARGERTPDGPHTHVLPVLLADKAPALGVAPVLDVYINHDT